MAQTRYDPDGAYLYAKALRDQGTNPIVSWFTDSQGGGLNNWIQDQGNQIATRTRNDILRELTDDPMMLERARTAQNEGRDFRKELLGDKYFVNPHDAVLNAGVDNVKTKNENRLRKKFSEALAENINADTYKADGTTAEALAESLGYKNLSPELLSELKEGEQDALKKRYENQIYREIAQKRLENPNATVDDVVGTYRDRYGLNLNPDTYLDPENETMKKFMKAGIQDNISNILGSGIALPAQEEVLKKYLALHPEYSDMLNESISNVSKDTEKHYEDAFFKDYDKLKEAQRNDKEHSYSNMELLELVASRQRKSGAPAEVVNKILQREIQRLSYVKEPETQAEREFKATQAKYDIFRNEHKEAFAAMESKSLPSSLDKSQINTNGAKATIGNIALKLAYPLKPIEYTQFINFMLQDPIYKDDLKSEEDIKGFLGNEQRIEDALKKFIGFKNTSKAFEDEKLKHSFNMAQERVRQGRDGF